MDMEKFIELVKEALEKKTGKEVIVHKTVKNNGVTLTGVSLKDEEVNMLPIIYLDEYLNNWQKYKSIDNITDIIIEKDNEFRVNKIYDFKYLCDFNEIKDKIRYKLVNYSENKKRLQNMPHERFLDLAKVYYVVLELDNGNGTTNIYNKNMEMWGVTQELLEKIASENTQKYLPSQVEDITNEIKRIVKNSGCEDDYIEEMLETTKDDKCQCMYVMSNPQRTYGAAVLCYQESLRKFAEEKESDLIIIPSSIHEIILLKGSDKENISELREMVKEVNNTELSKDEILSYSIYYYDRNTESIINL